MPETNPPSRDGLTVITTHINADFDGISSVLAAHKLYPGSVVVLPNAGEKKNLKNFFISSLLYLFNMKRSTDIAGKRVSRVVLVDTRDLSRLGEVAAIITEQAPEIHIYDHHPDQPESMKGTLEVIRPAGATASILTTLMQERGIELSREEATIICLGIYEDTGSFTYASTTPEDFQAAAWLVSLGANLDIVSSLIAKELDPAQVALINEMLNRSERRMVNGVEVTLVSLALEEYVPDLATLVQKMMRMESLGVLFVLAGMGNRIHVVARSCLPEVDCGAILADLGGGGHPFAASASIRNMPLAQVEEKLGALLAARVKPIRTARHLMSAPVITTAPLLPLSEASRLLTRYSINALVVTTFDDENEQLLGYITRQVIERALSHNLGACPVQDFMFSSVATASPDTDFNTLVDRIIGDKQRLLPIVENDRVVGVVTRTDLLNLLVYSKEHARPEGSEVSAQPHYPKQKPVVSLMRERLTKEMLDLLGQIGRVAHGMGFGVFVVGGFVRDLLLRRENDDIDIVIEGDGITFAKAFAEMMGARINTYTKFGTSVIIFPNGFKVDVATARMEYYPFPAALPEVETSSIKLDLYRRDFTINTLAIRLDPDGFGTLTDFFNGQRDIKEKRIRILHNLSFVEDPTRVFRAIKFEQRFGFTIGKVTREMIKNAIHLDVFRELGGLRVFNEFRQILEEENPVPAILRIFDLGLMEIIHPGITRHNELIDQLDEAKKVLAWHDLMYTDEPIERWVIYFLTLLALCDREVSEVVARRLMLPPKHRKLLTEERFHARGAYIWLTHGLPAANSDLHRQLSPLRTELLLYVMAISKDEAIKKAISHYMSQLRHITLSIKGRDLKTLGLKPGPRYSQILADTLAAKLDGKLKDRDDELAFAAGYLEG
ncbi:CBS domain-containing protein [Desulfoluna spongiiphila]|uniref:CBS domain-containing protein n=1 Tax=Desulfoluna spongiiphila TaxID=419481 RepID=UPI00125754FA|nr:CBS domain-containing protein [Desulfoluna spongiiphila]VVS91200.1 dhh phosphoesterase superfamily [Desulfoluna spongiiphila]